MTLCVYALTAPGAKRFRATGLSDERLRIVAAGRLAAIVGELPRPPRVTAANLTAYSGVMDRLHRALPALLPARFGTCMLDLDELLFVLRTRRTSLLPALRHVRGRSQMTVRVYGSYVSTGFSRPNPRSPTRGTHYLRARQAAIGHAHALPAFAPIHDAVQRWVRDERVENREKVSLVYHLVPNGAIERYRRALERASAAAGLPVVVTGPFPPYAFGE